MDCPVSDFIASDISKREKLHRACKKTDAYRFTPKLYRDHVDEDTEMLVGDEDNVYEDALASDAESISSGVDSEDEEEEEEEVPTLSDLEFIVDDDDEDDDDDDDDDNE